MLAAKVVCARVCMCVLETDYQRISVSDGVKPLICDRCNSNWRFPSRGPLFVLFDLILLNRLPNPKYPFILARHPVIYLVKRARVSSLFFTKLQASPSIFIL